MQIWWLSTRRDLNFWIYTVKFKYFFQDLHLSFWDSFKIAFIEMVISQNPRGCVSCAESSHLCWHNEIYLISLLFLLRKQHLSSFTYRGVPTKKRHYVATCVLKPILATVVKLRENKYLALTKSVSWEIHEWIQSIERQNRKNNFFHRKPLRIKISRRIIQISWIFTKNPKQ